MSGTVTVTLTLPQAQAVLSAIAEIMAGDTSDWPAPSFRALLNAEAKIAEATAS